ncbi:MAG: polysaccharide deacetylase family protein [Actinomycetota bacterium]|nr:polysaccharide deacetylase family protein [Actinomycetota bacterium]
MRLKTFWILIILALTISSFLFFWEGRTSIPGQGDMKSEALKRKSYQDLPEIPVLAYHGVQVENVRIKNYDTIAEDKLEEHFKYISQNFEPITVDELLAYYRLELEFTEKRPILIFFDDGLRSVYEYAFPLAKEYGVEFTVAYLPSGREPYPIDGKMTWQELGEMKESGLVEVASHSFDHFDLTSLAQDELRYQLTASKRIIEKNLGPCSHLVAPYGKSDERVRQIAREVGYRSLFVHGRTVIEDDSLFDPFVIKRIAVSSDYGDKDLSKLK